VKKSICGILRERYLRYFGREKRLWKNNNTKTGGGAIVENNSAVCLVVWLGGNSAKDELIRRSIIPQFF
jgi:hypothetical protein